MATEIRANERDNVGLVNRPRYGTAQRSILRLGAVATPHLLRHLENLGPAQSGSPEKDLADDVTELLGKLRDPSAVPKLASLLLGPGIWVSVPFALAKTEEGTQVLLDAAESREHMVRAQAMSVWSSDCRPAEVVTTLVADLDDPDAYVRGEAVSAVVARAGGDEPIIAALRQMRSSDPDERLRDRADSALRRLGVAS